MHENMIHLRQNFPWAAFLYFMSVQYAERYRRCCLVVTGSRSRNCARKISVHPAGMQYSWIVCVGLQYIDVVALLLRHSLMSAWFASYCSCLFVCLYSACRSPKPMSARPPCTAWFKLMHDLVRDWSGCITGWLRSRCAGSSKASNFRSLSLSAVQLACLVCSLSCMHACMHTYI